MCILADIRLQIEVFNSRCWPTCKTTGVRAFRPRRPIRQLAVDRALDHAGSVHLPFFIETKLKEQRSIYSGGFSKEASVVNNVLWTEKYLLAKLQVHGLGITANTVQHARLESNPAHGSLTQLTSAPVWMGNIDAKGNSSSLNLTILNQPLSLYHVKIHRIV